MTKKDRIARCREIIDANGFDTDFSNEHLVEFVGLVGVDGISAIQRRRNPKYPSDPRHLYACMDGHWDSFSWNKAITPRKALQLEKEVMRASVVPDILEYKDGCGIEFCEHCGAEDHLQVDHSDPAFDTIALAFMEEYGVPETEPCPSNVGHRFRSMDVEARWITYHTVHANYQILCRSCNASKGKTKAVRRSVFSPSITSID